MPGTFFGFNTALRGMQAQQRGIYTTSHNIANANTEGYTRQQVVLAATPAYPVPAMNRPGGQGWQIGTGVDSQETRRLRDEFLDTQIRRETGSLGQWQQIQDVLQQVEVVFNEPSDTGLSTLMSQFWAAWQELSKNAESSPVRTTVVETANALAEAFNHSYQQLTTIQEDITGENGLIALRVTDINSIAKQISDLNGQIKNIIAAGDQPNDLIDQRDLLLDRLSKIIDFQVEPNIITVNGKEVFDGQIKIKLRDANTNYLVKLDNNQSVINKIKSVDGKIYMESDINNQTEINFNSGEIKGLQDALYDVDTYLNKLNTLARGLAENINSIHKEGYNLNCEKVDNTYENFFVALTDPSNPNKNISADNITAGNIAVNPNIRNDVSQIAAAYPDPPNDTSSIAPGNGYNALRIAQLQTQLLQESDSDNDSKFDTLTSVANGNSGGVTFDDYYKNFTAKLGVDAHEATRMTTNQGVLVDQLNNRKDSISGVSLDEEMASMLQYQRAFEASARMITTLDSMLDKIINGMGVTR
ncbi:flagellar hook-associated protein FlgK [Neomoorella thermoacetica]|uniref:flagellar hook-associated protein FlgK n=1 Tax=Neomoorella thermoacetica TaxID=1525 RepID=UPI00091CC2C5|nr:flagellar hook-associated protein FlgK [Moorella thermoacetica]OIQ55600.1 flagellar hook-associated protein 1 [Moorella thermoacetica]